MESLIGKTVVDIEGSDVSVRSITGPDTIIGLLFVWSKSIPCRVQIPKVVEYFQHTSNKKRNDRFHIIVIDRESSINNWNNYRKTLPWLAVPYGMVHETSSKFTNVSGFPTFQLYNGQTGRILASDIMDDILYERQIPYLTK